RVVGVEEVVRQRLGDDLETLISEIGVTPDWAAAYTPNSGPMDAVLKVQLKADRARSAQEYVQELRQAFNDPASGFGDLEFSFDAGGMIRGAMNEGKSTPINVRVVAKDPEKAHQIAENLQREVQLIKGVVDARVVQRRNYPQYRIIVDRAKSADLGLSQVDVM